MIKLIKVDGFKSLKNFKLELTEGLNILVGPNGSGKTNILSFFQFLGYLMESNVSEAISRCGGAGAVLSKVENGFRSSLKAVIHGNVAAGKKVYFYYKYEFTIGIQHSGELFTFRYQRLQLKRRTVVTRDPRVITEFDLDVSVTKDKEGKTKAEVASLDRRKLSVREPFFGQGKKLTKPDIVNYIESNLCDNSVSDESLINAISMTVRDVMHVGFDIGGGKVYNIVPSLAKIPEDSAKPPGINNDGSGIYSTLYSIQKASGRERIHLRYGGFYRPFGRRLSQTKVTLDKVVKFIQLANPAIEKIEVSNDPFDNQLQVRIKIEGDDNTVLPLQSMSDGTIKWISLMLVIMTDDSTYS
ncbi:MAG: AAA family ATPase, partial [Mariprofundaceae bacterium]|nr:AAA family ATPase [Mariprofundaceae bacterium]